MAIKNETLDTLGKNIFLCPADEEHAVTCVVLCNYSAVQVNVSVYAIPNGVVAVGTGSIIIKDLVLPPSETFSFDTEKFVLTGGDRIHAVASVNTSVTATVSSMRVS